MKELIELSKKIGFMSKSKIWTSTEFWTIKMSAGERDYFFMCELQKWLRDEKKEHIVITYMAGKNNFNVSLTMRSMGWGCFDTYEQALQQGLIEAIRIIL